MSTSRIGTYRGNKNPIYLSCVANGVPAPSYTWNNPNGDEIHTGGTVIVSKPTKEQFGNYICTAKNKLGTKRHTIKVVEISKFVVVFILRSVDIYIP